MIIIYRPQLSLVTISTSQFNASLYYNSIDDYKIILLSDLIKQERSDILTDLLNN
jgi:hypothetical protein